MATFSLNPATESALHLKRIFNKPPDKVRKAFLDATLLARWWPPEGWAIDSAQWKPATGSAFRIETKNRLGETQATYGEFQDAGQMLVFSWAKEGKADIGGTLVTVEFRKVAAGTELALTHELMPNKAAREAHQAEWLGRLERLSKVI